MNPADVMIKDRSTVLIQHVECNETRRYFAGEKRGLTIPLFFSPKVWNAESGHLVKRIMTPLLNEPWSEPRPTLPENPPPVPEWLAFIGTMSEERLIGFENFTNLQLIVKITFRFPYVIILKVMKL